jgi:ribonuclease R
MATDLKSPVGEVIDVLGDKGNNNTEMHAILPNLVYLTIYLLRRKAAKQIDDGLFPKKLQKRPI